MRIILVSPLYPPDVAYPAPYVKELAARLSAIAEYNVTIVTYADIPEEIKGVQIHTVSKHMPLSYRIFTYTLLLLRELRGADVVYSENGTSVELPIVVATFFRHVPLVMHLSDTFSHTRASKSTLYGTIEKLALSRAKKVISISPAEKPEILPFVPSPTTELASYKKSWDEHIALLTSTFAYVKN